MRTKPAYTECSLYYDGIASVDVGEFLKTPGGSAYLIQHVRQDKSRAYRVHLKCLRWPVDKIPADAKVHPLHWYPRKKKRGTSLREIVARTA